MKKQIQSEESPWWRNLSPDSTKKLLVVVDLLLAKIEINGINRLLSMKVPKSEFEDNGISDFDEVIIMANRLSAGGTLFKVANMDFTTRLLFHKNEEPKDNLVFSIVNSNVEDELGKIKNELAQTQTLPATPVDEANAVNRPYCLTEKGIGYLKFGKYGRKKKIGSKDSRPYLFLDCILVQIEAFKTIEAVFSAIWQEKDGKDQRLTDP